MEPEVRLVQLPAALAWESRAMQAACRLQLLQLLVLTTLGWLHCLRRPEHGSSEVEVSSLLPAMQKLVLRVLLRA